jgi:anionic cell wall polymer biosynthesis LytR-Cps2A-Psr (LCP) family protein
MMSDTATGGFWKNRILKVAGLVLLLGLLAGGVRYYRNWSAYQALEPGSETEEVEAQYPGPWTVQPAEDDETGAEDDETGDEIEESDEQEEQDIQKPTEQEPKKKEEETVAAGERLHILLLGLDGGQLLADVAMVVTVDTGGKTGRVISIPRDTLAYLPEKGRDGICKLTEIYWYGGGREDMLKNVRRITGISPHYYVEVTFNGFINIVDAVGGVNFNGNRLNGREALAVARDRSECDFTRVDNQQKIVFGLLRELSNVKDAGTVISLIKTALANVRTNVSFSKVNDLYSAVGDMDPSTVYFYTVPTRWENINGVYYCVPE